MRISFSINSLLKEGSKALCSDTQEEAEGSSNRRIFVVLALTIATYAFNDLDYILWVIGALIVLQIVSVYIANKEEKPEVITYEDTLIASKSDYMAMLKGEYEWKGSGLQFISFRAFYWIAAASLVGAYLISLSPVVIPWTFIANLLLVTPQLRGISRTAKGSEPLDWFAVFLYTAGVFTLMGVFGTKFIVLLPLAGFFYFLDEK